MQVSGIVKSGKRLTNVYKLFDRQDVSLLDIGTGQMTGTGHKTFCTGTGH